MNLARLKELLHYDPTTGVFTALVSRGAIRQGAVVGSLTNCGYLAIRVDYKPYLAHRLAWFYVNGCWPDDIDHRDGVRTNNAYSNLRSCTRAENMQNLPATGKQENTSGHLGVYWDSKNMKWKAQIGVDGKKKSLGRYVDLPDAVAAYTAAKAKLHTFNPGARA
jgi:hypothetical protein